MAKMLTKEQGLITFIIKGVNSKKSKKKALISSLNLLEVSYRSREDSELQLAREISVVKPYNNLNSDVVKNALVLFIREVLYKVIREDRQDKEVFELYQNQLDNLESSQHYGNFHLEFMLRLSHCLGFAPQNNYSEQASSFSLTDGKFMPYNKNDDRLMSPNLSKLLADLLAEKEVVIHSNDKYLLIDNLLDYFRNQLDYMQEVNSHKIFREVFA